MDFSAVLERLLNAQLDIGPGILWREIIGNGFGLASAILGMQRKVLAWPIGIVGNILLFTVFLGGVFHTPQNLDLYGQAARQVFFLAVSVYGWYRWYPFRKSGAGGADGSETAGRSRVLVTRSLQGRRGGGHGEDDGRRAPVSPPVVRRRTPEWPAPRGPGA